MQIVIDIPEESYIALMEIKDALQRSAGFEKFIVNGIPLPKGHGRLIDVSKIEEDRIDDNNPIIYLTVNGEYVEAVSLDYLNSLSTIIEADGGVK